MPPISIFIPLYNSELFIQKTIESVLSQTYQDWELFIIDDNSKDNSYAVAKAFELKDKRIKVFKNDTNLGMMGNWNKGIEMCHSDYFVKLDADDSWHPDFLQESFNIMSAHPEVALVFTKYINIDDAGETIPDSELSFPEFAKEKPFDTIDIVKQGQDKMLSYSILRQGLSLIRTKVFKEIGVYRYLLTPETQASTDTEFYFRVGCHYKIYCIDKTLYYYRIHQNSISYTNAKDNLSAQKLYEIKYCILQYYFKQGKIGESFFNQQIKGAEYYYNLFRAYKGRAEQKYIMSLKWMLRNFYLALLTTIKFYIGRI